MEIAFILFYFCKILLVLRWEKEQAQNPSPYKEVDGAHDLQG
jgi:hypothetical protein